MILYAEQIHIDISSFAPVVIYYDLNWNKKWWITTIFPSMAIHSKE
jgi:hypothetical protein